MYLGEVAYCNQRACMSVRERISRTRSNCMLPVARFSPGGVAICYVFPVVWIASCLHTIGEVKATTTGRVYKRTVLGRCGQVRCLQLPWCSQELIAGEFCN